MRQEQIQLAVDQAASQAFGLPPGPARDSAMLPSLIWLSLDIEAAPYIFAEYNSKSFDTD